MVPQFIIILMQKWYFVALLVSEFIFWFFYFITSLSILLFVLFSHRIIFFSQPLIYLEYNNIYFFPSINVGISWVIHNDLPFRFFRFSSELNVWEVGDCIVFWHLHIRFQYLLIFRIFWSLLVISYCIII